MKKFLILPILLGLTACKEQPMVETDLVCRTYSESLGKSVDIGIDFRAYKDYAVMSIAGGKEMKLPLVSEFERPGYVNLKYYGEQWGMSMDLDTELGIVRYFFINNPEDGPNTGTKCDVLVKYNSDKYVAPTELEKCVEFIANKVYLKDTKNPSAGLEIPYEIRHYHADGGWATFYEQFDVPAEDAKDISPNWDYANMKLYSLKDGIQEHEQDACQVRYKLMQYMDDKDIREPRKEYAKDAKSEAEVLVPPAKPVTVE